LKIYFNYYHLKIILGRCGCSSSCTSLTSAKGQSSWLIAPFVPFGLFVLSLRFISLCWKLDRLYRVYLRFYPSTGPSYIQFQFKGPRDSDLSDSGILVAPEPPSAHPSKAILRLLKWELAPCGFVRYVNIFKKYYYSFSGLLFSHIPCDSRFESLEERRTRCNSRRHSHWFALVYGMYFSV
jgi:hypothetical protein